LRTAVGSLVPVTPWALAWIALVSTLLSAVGAAPARACGHCLEDRIAVVYDHAMVTAARARRHGVVYLAVGNPGAASTARIERVRRALGTMPGVDARSVRTDVSAAVAAFSFDPARAPLDALVPRLRALAGPGVRCDTLRVDPR
jgi:hypothetical protein